MHFCAREFAVFFLLFLALYWSLPWHRARVYLLLSASFFFYATWNAQLAFLIVVSTTLDYWLARGIDATYDPRRRRWLLGVNVVANLSLLCYFKYSNFFIEPLNQLLLSAGLGEAAIRPLKLLVPVGISFYTFEAISYMVDVYRGRVRAEKDLASFQLFILFFPHLVAGPIVRGRDFLPQVARRKRFSWPRMQVGVQLFLFGLMKKIVVADRMAVFVDPVYENPAGFSTYATWIAVLAYALQIYGDFSGYSDMAFGCAHMLGYKLTRNFDMPYLALNISDFWRRWHISLSSWLRDYLFIPIGGSHGGRWRTCRNLLVTMALGGLWHGASWTFVAWGVLHGLYLIVHRLFREVCTAWSALERFVLSAPGTALRWALTFSCVAAGWVFFRATTFEAAATVFRKLLVHSTGEKVAYHTNGFWFTLAVVFACHAAAARCPWGRWVARVPAPVLGGAYAVLLTVAQLLSPAQGKAFIYFQF
jgi:alginate O-acetyltransferase complex protein AlgI